MGLATLISSIVLLFSPLAASLGWKAMLGQRILLGLFLGMVTPCHNVVWSKWAPKYERSKLLTISRGGCHVGSIVSMFGSGLIASSSLGWPAVFYFFGVLGIVWYVFWVIFAYESPESHPTITEEEKRYIGVAWNRIESDTFVIPWGSMLSSPPVWAAIVGQFAEFWILYTMGVCMTIYIKEILKYDVDQTGFISAIPNVLLAIVVPTSGFISDVLRRKRIMDTTAVRKTMQGTGLLMCGFLMVTMGYAENRIITVIMLSLAISMMGLCESGALINFIDIAPKYAGILMGIGQCVATIPGIIGNYLVGVITKNETEAEWQIFFEITLGICVVGALIFSIFGSGRKQPWAMDYQQI